MVADCSLPHSPRHLGSVASFLPKRRLRPQHFPEHLKYLGTYECLIFICIFISFSFSVTRISGPPVFQSGFFPPPCAQRQSSSPLPARLDQSRDRSSTNLTPAPPLSLEGEMPMTLPRQKQMLKNMTAKEWQYSQPGYFVLALIALLQYLVLVSQYWPVKDPSLLEPMLT